MHGQFCYPSVAFLRPQFGVFATDGDFATRVGTFATLGGNFATKMVILLPPRSPALVILLPSGKAKWVLKTRRFCPPLSIAGSQRIVAKGDIILARMNSKKKGSTNVSKIFYRA